MNAAKIFGTTRMPMWRANNIAYTDPTVYVITSNQLSPHMLALFSIFRKSQVIFRIQNQKNYLEGVDQNSLREQPKYRCFVIVDNIKGIVKLGPFFSSVHLLIIGYPNNGPNPKNCYCTSESKVMQKYSEFINEKKRKSSKEILWKIGNVLKKSERSLLAYNQTNNLTSEPQKKNNMKLDSSENQEKIQLYVCTKSKDQLYQRIIAQISQKYSSVISVVRDIKEVSNLKPQQPKTSKVLICDQQSVKQVQKNNCEVYLFNNDGNKQQKNETTSSNGSNILENVYIFSSSKSFDKQLNTNHPNLCQQMINPSAVNKEQEPLSSPLTNTSQKALTMSNMESRKNRTSLNIDNKLSQIKAKSAQDNSDSSSMLQTIPSEVTLKKFIKQEILNSLASRRQQMPKISSRKRLRSISQSINIKIDNKNKKETKANEYQLTNPKQNESEISDATTSINNIRKLRIVRSKSLTPKFSILSRQSNNLLTVAELKSSNHRKKNTSTDSKIPRIVTIR